MTRLVLILILLLPGPVSALQPSPGAFGPEGPRLREQFWLIPSAAPAVLMRASVFRPPGEGPFPLAVIGHGSMSNPEERIRLALPILFTLTRWLVGEGYAVVVPERRGHGGTGGPYAEHNSPCENPNFVRSGLETARDLRAAVQFMRRQPFVSSAPALVVGQSAGGFGGLALAAGDTAGIGAVVNFAGGRGGRVGRRPHNNCAPQKLIEAARVYGRTARIPTLWIYTENDSYFAPWIARGMAEAFATAGGQVVFHMLPPFEQEGHTISVDPDGPRIWAPIVRDFLRQTGQKR
jgi:dienelactone hydrolase